MKYLRFYLCLLCAVAGIFSVDAQKLAAGIMTGPNFSNIRGDNQYGKWGAEMGAVSGLWVNYSITPALGVGTEINYTSLYYQHTNYTEYYVLPGSEGYLDYVPRSIPYKQYWNFKYLRVPLYVKLSTPTKLRFDLLVGAFYAHLLSPEKESYNSDPYPENEMGWLVGAGFSYPVTDKIELFVQGRYAMGGKKYVADGRNGDFELMFGVGYSFFNRMNVRFPSASGDSTFRFTMKYRAGVVASWIKADERQGAYSPGWGFTTGVAANYALGEHAGLQAELLYENKGYRMADSTSSYFRYVQDGYSSDYYTDTRVSISYLTIPVMLQFKTSGPVTAFVNTGVYYSARLKAKTVGTSVDEGRYEGYYGLTNVDVYDNIEGVVKPYDWGWIIGGGVQFPLKNNWKLYVEGRYLHGWTNIIDPEEYQGDNRNMTKSMKNRSISLFVSLQIPIH